MSIEGQRHAVELAKLEQRRKKLEDALTRLARDEAEAANEAKTLFLAAMSHELRTPLNAVIGLSDVIAMQCNGKPDQSKTSEMAQLISKNGSHLLHIVTDVLSIAEGEDSKSLSADMDNIDLIEALEFGIDTIKNDAKQNNIRIIWNGHKTPVNMRGDQPRLQQLFLNLLSNAVTFNNENGIIKVMVQVVKDKAVIIDIIDTGIGIPKDAMESIFEPFVQVDKGYSRNYDGVGLGLSVAKQMLDLHKGRMNIKSELGKGTIFALSLPVSLETQQTTTPQSAAAPKAVAPAMITPPAPAQPTAAAVKPSVPAPVSAPAPAPVPKIVQEDPAEQETQISTVDHLFEEEEKEEPPYSNLKVIVADDNPTNHLVVESLLQTVVGTIYRANNGQEVLELLELRHHGCHELHNDRCADIGHDPQSKNTHPAKRTTGEHRHHAANALPCRFHKVAKGA